MCLLSVQEEQFKDLYSELAQEWTTASQTHFTPRYAVKRLDVFLGCKSIAVFFNPEVVKYLVDLGYPEEQITFFSDDRYKEEIFLQGINCKVLPFNEENRMKHKKHFDGGSINPAFTFSKEMRRIAESMVKGKLLIVTPNRDLEDPKYLQNVEYFKNLSNTAFDEAIYTSLLIVNIENTPETIIVESTDGNNTTTVTNMETIPENDIESWLFAQKVFSLKLPGIKTYNSPGMYTATLEEAKKNDNGIKVICKVGYPDTEDFLLTKIVDSKYKAKLKGLGKYKLVVSRAANPYKVTVGKYAGPEWAIAEGVVAADFETEEEAREAVEYYNSSKVKKLIEGFASRKSNNQQFFNRIPHPMYSKKWDENL